jgi:hypothetical protein
MSRMDAYLSGMLRAETPVRYGTAAERDAHNTGFRGFPMW